MRVLNWIGRQVRDLLIGLSVSLAVFGGIAWYLGLWPEDAAWSVAPPDCWPAPSANKPCDTLLDI
jgi:hypothetical protein